MNGTIDLDAILTDLATDGDFHLEERLTESPGGSLYVVTSTTRPGLRLFAVERRDAEYAAGIANVGASQLREPKASPAALSPIQRAAAIGADLAATKAQLAVLERDAGSGSNSPNAGVSGAAERVHHDRLTSTIERLERELRALEAA